MEVCGGAAAPLAVVLRVEVPVSEGNRGDHCPVEHVGDLRERVRGRVDDDREEVQPVIDPVPVEARVAVQELLHEEAHVVDAGQRVVAVAQPSTSAENVSQYAGILVLCNLVGLCYVLYRGFTTSQPWSVLVAAVPLRNALVIFPMRKKKKEKKSNEAIGNEKPETTPLELAEPRVLFSGDYEEVPVDNRADVDDGGDDELADVVAEFEAKVELLRKAIRSRKVKACVRSITGKLDLTVGHAPASGVSIGSLGLIKDYCLPTTLKMLSSYAELQDIDSKEFLSTRDHILETLKAFDDGLGRAYDDLTMYDKIDLESDMRVMRLMPRNSELGLSFDDVEGSAE